MTRKALLALADGTLFEGVAFGADGEYPEVRQAFDEPVEEPEGRLAPVVDEVRARVERGAEKLRNRFVFRHALVPP